MNRRALKTMFAAVLCLGALASPALAQISISVDLGIAPPPPRHEVVHEARPGRVWIPGFWYWEGHRHLWSDGHWEKARRGQMWVPARWEDRGEYHHFEPGRWERHDERRERHDEGERGEHRGGSRQDHDRR